MNSDPIQAEWQGRRCELNHQWLKNKLISALDACSNALNGRVRSIEPLRDLFAIELAEWPGREQELKRLFDDFSSAMSPVNLLYQRPFSGWPADWRASTANLLHELWLARYAVERLLHDAQCALESASIAFRRLQKGIKIDTFDFTKQEQKLRFEEFRDACRLLAQTIERFPNQILVS